MNRTSNAPSGSRKPISGGRDPRSGGRRPAPAVRKVPERLEASPSSAAAACPDGDQPSSSADGNLFQVVLRVIGSLFGRWGTGSAKEKEKEQAAEGFKSPSRTPQRCTLGNQLANIRRRPSRGIYGSGDSSLGRPPGSMRFTMEEILNATDNFSPLLKIGQGGFGTVYKGTLGDGSVVAVKRAKKIVFDNHLTMEFQSEIKTLTRIEHLNLVRFFGYLECNDERILVVEYVPNGTLREHLDCLNGKHIDLAARLDIAIDVAHAVTYLHMYAGNPIIHRDIKSSNILLTDNLRAKVADFGFARLVVTEATHVSTQVKGTAGYLDPEYLRTYQLTEKSDVYSFGVLLVELITGRRPVEHKRPLRERLTAKWAMEKFVEGNARQILDPNLICTQATNLAIEQILDLSLSCLAPTRRDRPEMRRCAEILWDIRKFYRDLLFSDPRSKPSRRKHPYLVEENG